MMRTPEEERIFHALSQITTPACDLSGVIEQAGSHRWARLRPGRPLAVAAALCALLTIGAAAVGISGAWRYFAPSLPQTAVETVGVSQTAGDYTLTVVDAVADDSNILLLLALSRTDGRPIDPEASLNTTSMHLNLEIEAERGAGSSGMLGRQFSQDGTTLYLLFNASYVTDQPDTLVNQPLTLTADGVAVRLHDSDGLYHVRGDSPVSLAPLAEQENPDFSDTHFRGNAEEIARAAAAVGCDIPLPLDEQFPDYAVLGAAMTENGLSLVLRSGRYTSSDLVCTDVFPDTLIDTRTGEKYRGSSGQGATLEDGTRVVLWSFQDCPLALDDLPYLEVEVSYNMDRVLSDQPFSLTFTLGKSSGISIPIKELLELDGLTLHPTELRLSPLELRILFADGHEAAFSIRQEGTAPVLHLADGTEIATRWGGGRYLGGGTLPSVGFLVEDADGERIFIDPGQVVSITFGNLEIPVEH